MSTNEKKIIEPIKIKKSKPVIKKVKTEKIDLKALKKIGLSKIDLSESIGNFKNLMSQG